MSNDNGVREEAIGKLMESARENIFTNENQSIHVEINQILLQAIMLQQDVALIDMPQLLLRMKIVNEHSLAEI